MILLFRLILALTDITRELFRAFCGLAVLGLLLSVCISVSIAGKDIDYKNLWVLDGDLEKASSIIIFDPGGVRANSTVEWGFEVSLNLYLTRFGGLHSFNLNIL